MYIFLPASDFSLRSPTYSYASLKNTGNFNQKDQKVPHSLTFYFIDTIMEI